jgi:hypothetical protein
VAVLFGARQRACRPIRPVIRSAAALGWVTRAGRVNSAKLRHCASALGPRDIRGRPGGSVSPDISRRGGSHKPRQSWAGTGTAARVSFRGGKETRAWDTEALDVAGTAGREFRNPGSVGRRSGGMAERTHAPRAGLKSRWGMWRHPSVVIARPERSGVVPRSGGRIRKTSEPGT